MKISALLILIPAFISGQQITELIHPLKLTPGGEKTFLISDLFYSENYDELIFIPDSTLKVFYDSINRLLNITSLKNYEGYSILPFHFYDNSYNMLCKTEFKQSINFSYKPDKPVARVNLFGSFNGWNRENLPMTDEDGDGIYTTIINLEEGRYEYKFYLNDGDEIIDPLNPDSIPNGLGGWNSVMVIDPLYSGEVYLHLLDYSVIDSSFQFTFYYESASADDFDIIALLDNKILQQNNIRIQGRKIFIDIPAVMLKGYKTLRVAVNEKNRASNLQTILLKDGKPPDNNDTTWYDAIIYSIMVDRFNDGDSANSIPVEHPELLPQSNYYGGDLQGIINNLKDGYFDSLGINTLWLSPVIDNTPNAYQEYPEPRRYYTGYHGYWPVHPEKVEERFGDMNLLKKLISTAHSKGIKVLLDYVANHIHIEHPFWEEHRDWFGTLELPDGSRNLRRWDEYRLTTWFEPFMPKFDYENSTEALEVMTDNAVWWLKETNADGFRHDAVKHVPNQFWRTLTRKIKGEDFNKKIYQIGETFGSYELVGSYVNNGQLDAQFNFILYDTAIPIFIDSTASFISLNQQLLKSLDVYSVNNLMGNVIDSHDKVRFMAYADGDISLSEDNAIGIGWNNPPEVDKPESYNKLKLYTVFIITIPGLPVIYYGDEFGMTGAGDPDNRRMMRFDDDLTKWEKETLIEIKKIIHLRNKYTALRYGDFRTIYVDEDCYAYLRSDFSERILVALNKSSNKKIIDIHLPGIYNFEKAVDLMNRDVDTITDNNLLVDLNGVSFKIFKLE